MFSEDDHKHEGHKMGLGAKLAWMAVAWISLMMLLSTCSPEVDPVTQEPRKTWVKSPLYCYHTTADNKLVCDVPPDYQVAR